MSHRNRIRCIAMVMAIPCLLAAPFVWKWAAGAKVLSYVKYLVFGLLGIALFKDSSGETAKMKWAYGASGLYFGYFAFDLARDTFNGFNGFGLASLSGVAAGLLAAWACALCAFILFGVMGSSANLSETSGLPVMATSWALGVVTTLAGVNTLFQMRLDGFFGTIGAVTIALLAIGFGVMMVKGKQPHLACYGLGTVVGSYLTWQMLTDDGMAMLAMLAGRIAFYGMFTAVIFTAVVATWALGAEVAAAQRKLTEAK
jgi:hypothetical protein